MSIDFNIEPTNQSIIKVIGVGGGGGNAVNNMFHNGINGVDFLICNTDYQVLDKSPIPNKIQLGEVLTSGLGAGANPEVGRNSAIESLEDIKKILTQNTKMVFVTAGMGGGTGTGAAPVIAQLARDMGILTVGIVTTPFHFEGTWRRDIAYTGVVELEKCVDTLLVIDNNNLLKTCPKNIAMRDAYLTADQILSNAAKGIAEIITVSGYVNVDFADVQTIMRNSGTALMGMSTKTGKDRAEKAIIEALTSPLLDNVDINGATGILVNITTSPEHRMNVEEYTLIGDQINSSTGGNARIIIGSVDTADVGEAMTVTVIATGFKRTNTYQVSQNSFKIAAKEDVKPENKLQTTTQPQSVISASPDPVPNTPEKIVVRTSTAQNTEKNQVITETKKEPHQVVTASPQLEPSDEPQTVKIQTKQVVQMPSKSYISPEERLSRMSNYTVDIHSNNVIKEFEDVPAYERRRQAIDYEYNYESKNRISNLSINGGSSRYLIRDNNPYLFDNVD